MEELKIAFSEKAQYNEFERSLQRNKLEVEMHLLEARFGPELLWEAINLKQSQLQQIDLTL